MKGLFFGFVAASFLVVSCTGGDEPVTVKYDTPAVESMDPEEQAAFDARKSELTEQLVGDYKGLSTVSEETRERMRAIGRTTDRMDEELAIMVVDMEMRADGTCTYTWTLGDEQRINEGTWVVTEDLAHVTISMEGIPEGDFMKMGRFSSESELDFAISDDKKTLSWSLDSFGMETGQVFIRK